MSRQQKNFNRKRKSHDSEDEYESDSAMSDNEIEDFDPQEYIAVQDILRKQQQEEAEEEQEDGAPIDPKKVKLWHYNKVTLH